MKDELVGLSDHVWDRTRARLQGLADEEYRWEPVPGAWTVRRRGDGRWHPDGVFPPPEPAPFTTLAWRVAHLTACYGADRDAALLGVAPEPPVLDPAGAAPGSAGGALDLLERAHARWRAHLVAVPAGSLGQPLGPAAGPFAQGTRAGFALHMIDEFVHHAAEVALLRDLYRATAAGAALVTGEPLVDAALRDPQSLQAADPGGHPGAVLAAASAGRWDLVCRLTELGSPVDGPPGRAGPLHLAAGAGALDAVQALVERGADTSAVDPDFGATPLGWAQYFGRTAAAAYLAER